jgi:type I restriction enzyme S subunit
MLLSNLYLLATAPSGVARLRELILTLAVQGKLLPQDPADEPASELLKKVRAEKDRLIAEGKIKRDKPLAEISEEEQPFEVPQGWEWIRFGEASINRDGERIPVSSSDRENRAKVYDYYGASGVIDKIDGYLFEKTLLLIGEDGANLINRSTPIAFLAHGKYWVNNHAHVIDTTHSALMNYLALFINAISLEPYVTGTAQPR